MSRSDPEEALAWQMAALLPHNLAGYEREHRFRPPRRWRFDFAWPERKVAVEVEGGSWTNGRHTRGAGFEADLEKYNEAGLQGWTVIRVTPKMIDDGRAINLVIRGLTT